MAFCTNCGAGIQEGVKFCPECGTPTSDVSTQASQAFEVAPPIENIMPGESNSKKKKSIFRRWWFWVLALIVLISAFGRLGGRKKPEITRNQPETKMTAAPTPKATQKPTPTPTPTTPPPETPALAEDEIRPEVKEFLDAYEAFMDEYVEFMKKFTAADSNNMLSMMTDYYTILARYNEFTETLEAIDESRLTNAELAYYIEVTSRVSQKLLTALGG